METVGKTLGEETDSVDLEVRRHKRAMTSNTWQLSRKAGYSNATILSTELVSDVDALIAGAQLDLRNLLNLYSLVDAVVLSPQCLMFGFSDKDVQTRPLYSTLFGAGLIDKASSLLDIESGTAPKFAFSALVSTKINEHALWKSWRGNDGDYVGLEGEALIFLEYRTEIERDFDITNPDYMTSRKYQDFLERFLADSPSWQGDVIEFLIRDIRGLELLLHAHEEARNKTGFAIAEDSFLSCMAKVLASQSLRTESSLYGVLAKHSRSLVNQMNSLSSRTITYVPPLATILLSRVKSRDDLPSELILLRDEFSALAAAEREFALRLESDDLSLEERVELIEEFETMRSRLISRFGTKKKRKKWLYRAWDVVKSFNPVTITSAVVDALIANEKSFRLRHRVQPYLRLSEQFVSTPRYERLIRQVFGTEPDLGMYQRFGALDDQLEEAVRQTINAD